MLASSFLPGQCVGWPGLADRGLMCLQHGFPLGGSPGQFYHPPTHLSWLSEYVISTVVHCEGPGVCHSQGCHSYPACWAWLQPSGTIPQAHLVEHFREQGCIFLYNWLQKRDLSMNDSPSFWNSSVLISLFTPLIFL